MSVGRVFRKYNTRGVCSDHTVLVLPPKHRGGGEDFSKSFILQLEFMVYERLFWLYAIPVPTFDLKFAIKICLFNLTPVIRMKTNNKITFFLFLYI